MTETFADHSALVTWSTPLCPFTIEYSRKALDDIRLAVVDAFFSLPRGGAEIGGILLGRLEGNSVQILDYAPIECEHAFGPAFMLSPADQAKLGDMLRQSHPAGLRPVGWYHSHTRSEISLCEADLDIHNRYFPERWQVALVLRPSTLQPTQAGFFFREPDGSIRAEGSYQEFVVEPLPLQQVPAVAAETAPGPVRETEPEAVVINLSSAEAHAVPQPSPEAEAQTVEAPREPDYAPASEALATPEPEPAAAPLLLPAPAEVMESVPLPHASDTLYPEERDAEPAYEPADATPSFGHVHEEEPRAQRPWIGIAAALAVGLALGVMADQARSHARPAPVVSAHQAPVPAKSAAPSAEDMALRKQNADLQKQIADLSQQNSALRQDNASLTQEQADLTKQKTDASKQQGDLAKRQADIQQQRDALAKQTAKLKADLGAQTARAQSLQQQVDDLRRQLQRRRLSIQSSDPLP